MPEDQLAAAQGRLPSQISRRAATPVKTENHEMRERDLSAARTLPSLEQKLIQSAERAAALEADRTQLTPMPPTLGRAARAKAATSPAAAAAFPAAAAQIEIGQGATQAVKEEKSHQRPILSRSSLTSCSNFLKATVAP